MNSVICLGLASAFLLNMQIVCAEQAKLILGTKVDNHVMQNEKSRFAFHDGKVCAQIALQPSHDGNVTFVWMRNGSPYAEFTTATKQSMRYRTHACVTARPGKWHVAVKDANTVLVEKDFIVDGDVASKQEKPKTVAPVAVEKTVKAEKPKTDKLKMDKPKDVIVPIEADKTKTSGIGEALKAIEPTDSEKLASAQKATAAQKTALDGTDSEKSMPKADVVKSIDVKAIELKTPDAKVVEAKSAEVKVVESTKDLAKK